MTTTLKQSQPVARVNHICDWCGEEILKGEKYNYWTGIFYNEFQANKMHLECHSAYCSQENGEWADGYIPHEHKRGGLEER